MDGLSSAASAMAVVSLAVQVAASISKLREFYESMKKAPKVNAAITRDLAQLSSILDAIQADEQSYNDVLLACMQKIEDLNHITDELEPGFRSTSRKIRQWTAFKAARKESILKRFRTTLEETKTTLILALFSKHLLLSQTQASQLQSMELWMREFLQTCLSEILRSHTSLSGSVESIATRIADFSVSPEPQVISNGSCLPSLPNLHLPENRVPTNDEIRGSAQGSTMRLNAESVIQPRTTFPKHRHSKTQQVASISWKAPQYSYGGSFTRLGNTDPPVKEESALQGRVMSSCRRCMRLETSTNTIKEFLGGKIYITTKTYYTARNVPFNVEKARTGEQLEHETTYIYYPPGWMLRRIANIGINVLFKRTMWGVQRQISTFRAVPDDSIIFGLCRTGNLDGVRILLASRQASPWDVNSSGWTPLHMASEGAHVNVCRLLLSEGADPMARTYDLDNEYFESSRTAFSIAATSDNDITDHKKLDTLRLLDQYLEIEEEYQHGLTYLPFFLVGRGLAGRYDSTSGHVQSFLWLLNIYRFNLREQEMRGFVQRIYEYTLFFFWDASFARRVFTTLDIPIDVLAQPEGFSILHSSLAQDMANPYENTLTLVELGADIHRVGRDFKFYTFVSQMYGPICGLQSPTTVAMRNAKSFFDWRKILLKTQDSLENFVRKELHISPLASRGWTADTIMSLFTCRFESHWISNCINLRSALPKWFFRCERCDKWMRSPREIAWEATLQMIKDGRIAEVKELDQQMIDGFLPDAATNTGTTRGAESLITESTDSTKWEEELDRYGELKKVWRGCRLSDGECCWMRWPHKPLCEFHWRERFQKLCDLCELDDRNGQNKSWGSECEEDEAEKSELEEEEEEEDFLPRMPGSFDF